MQVSVLVTTCAIISYVNGGSNETTHLTCVPKALFWRWWVSNLSAFMTALERAVLTTQPVSCFLHRLPRRLDAVEHFPCGGGDVGSGFEDGGDAGLE